MTESESDMIIDYYSLFSHARFIILGNWTNGKLMILEKNCLENNLENNFLETLYFLLN